MGGLYRVYIGFHALYSTVGLEGMFYSEEALNKQTDWFVVCVHAIVFAINVGVGINIGFIVDKWFEPVFQGYWSWMSIVVSVLSGAAIGFGTFGMFLKTERAAKAILRIDHKGEFWFRMLSLIALNLIFLGIGVSGLLYRLQFVSQQGVIYLIIIGIALDCSQPLIAAVLHPLTHTPFDLMEQERLGDFQRNTVTEVYDELESRPLHEKYRAAFGEDEDVIDVVEGGIVEKQQIEQQKRIERAKKPLRNPLARKTQRLTVPVGGNEEEVTDFPQARRVK